MSRPSVRHRQSVAPALTLAVAAVLAGCARKHEGPEVGDSVTNWLYACADDGDCRGSASCLDHLCTLACSAPRPDVCSAIAASAVCKTSTPRACDIPCDGSEACTALGEGYVCRQGYCREGELEEDMPIASEPAGAKRSAPLTGEPYTIETSHPFGPGWREDEIVPGRRQEFAPEGVFRLSDDSSSAYYPQVSRQGDAWVVSWVLQEELGAGQRQWEIAKVHGGALDTWRTGQPQAVAAVRNDRGRFALARNIDPDTCELRVSDLANHTSSVLQWHCKYYVGEGAAFFDGAYPVLSVAPIEGSDDWLVTWTSFADSFPSENYSPGDLLVTADALMVARYTPGQSGWSGGPWRFQVPLDGVPPEQYAAGGDLWFTARVHDGGELLRLHDLAWPESPPLTPPPVASMPELHTHHANIAFIKLGDETVIVQRGEGLQTITIRDDDSLGEPTLLLPQVDEANATPLPGLEQIAVCVVQAGVSLLILDEHGALKHGPLWIQEDAKAITSAGREGKATACDLAWSGSELLVTWSTIEVRGPLVPSSPEPGSSAHISGRIVKMSAAGPEL